MSIAIARIPHLQSSERLSGKRTALQVDTREHGPRSRSVEHRIVVVTDLPRWNALRQGDRTSKGPTRCFVTTVQTYCTVQHHHSALPGPRCHVGFRQQHLQSGSMNAFLSDQHASPVLIGWRRQTRGPPMFGARVSAAPSPPLPRPAIHPSGMF